MATIDVTVVLATLNRSALLAGALRSLAAQSFDQSRFEVVVVDNGSTDDTQQVVQEMARKVGNIRYVQEPRLGLSNGRNRGLTEAAGAIVAFFDDDAEADPQWLERLFEVFVDDPAAGGAGGRIQVRWPGAKPSWMPAFLEAHYGRCDYGEARRVVVYPEYPYGANMAFRREVLLAVGGFRDEVGRKGKSLVAAGETELFYRLSQKNLRIVYEPSSLVHHLASPTHTTRRWILRRTFAHGLATSSMQVVNEAYNRRRWYHRFARAAAQSAIGLISTAAAFVTRREASIVMSRLATTMYWCGVSRGAATYAVKPPPAKAAI
jgi:glycosyltransferase involved in cell wall biosynthesis